MFAYGGILVPVPMVAVLLLYLACNCCSRSMYELTGASSCPLAAVVVGLHIVMLKELGSEQNRQSEMT